MPVKPTEILKKIPDTFSVLIGDFYAGKSIFNKKTIKGRQESDMRNRMLRMLSQTFNVCQKSIGKTYAIDSLRTCDFSIVIFENVGERTTKQGVKYLDNLKGFMTCTISEEREMKVDLVCAAYRGLGTLLMSYIREYAKHYGMKSIKLDAATIELACKFYGPKFEYEFSGEDAGTSCIGMERRRLRSNKLNQVYARQSNEKMFEMTYQTGIEPRTTRARVAAAAERPNSSNNNSNNNSSASENAYQGNNNTVASNNLKSPSSRKEKKKKVLKSLKRKRARPNVKKSRTKKLNRRRRRTQSSMSIVSYTSN